MILNYKSVFLVDAIGAFFSAVTIGIVLPRFVSLIGLPTHTLYFLAAIALAYAAFSFFCYKFSQPAKVLLLAIMLANLFYCVLTALIVVIHLREMANWGILYFAAEILIILSLVTIERRVFQGMTEVV